MRIYLLPYTFKTYLTPTKIHSGIDISLMQTAELLLSRGHEIRMFCVSGDMPEKYNLKTFVDDRPQDLKEYVQKNRKNIYQQLVEDIKKFQPDILFSTHDLSKQYDRLDEQLKLPIVYQTQTIPGFFSDLNNGNMLSNLSKTRLSVVCVSEYHKQKFQKYYSQKRSLWNFDSIHVEGIVPSSYCNERKQAVESDGVVRHISALNPEKKTFLIHEFLEDSNIKSEVFTTSSYLSSANDKILKYASDNLSKYGHITNVNADRDIILSSLEKAMCSFVGLASYDTYTITSLESLSKGVPLIVYGTKDMIHPALEMCDDVMREKFVTVIRTKQDFLRAVGKYSTYTLDDRNELAERTYKANSEVKFGKNLETIMKTTILKSKQQISTSSSLESFF